MIHEWKGLFTSHLYLSVNEEAKRARRGPSLSSVRVSPESHDAGSCSCLGCGAQALIVHTTQCDPNKRPPTQEHAGKHPIATRRIAPLSTARKTTAPDSAHSIPKPCCTPPSSLRLSPLAHSPLLRSPRPLLVPPPEAGPADRRPGTGGPAPARALPGVDGARRGRERTRRPVRARPRDRRRRGGGLAVGRGRVNHMSEGP